tara:strand:- start:888 stop:1637 length:750 start_codon:yes stop_codon:yes gene_type:complete
VKNWLKISYNRNLIFVLFFLVLINVFAVLSDNNLLIQVTKPLFIPFLFMYYLIKNKYINTVMIMFLVFSFLGDFSSVLFSNPLMGNLSSLFYCISYFSLAYAAVSRIRIFNIDRVVAISLLLVFSINAYLMYQLFLVLQIKIPDANEVAIFGVKGIALMALAFMAFATYLSKDSRASILFLSTALCFVFADVLYYISNYYVYHYTFVVLEKTLHLLGLFFLFNYIIEYNRKRKKRLVLGNTSTNEHIVI